jgi:hypothetical protein
MSRRPTRAEMEERLDAIFMIVEEIEPCGVRQAFYQTTVRRDAEGRPIMEKTEADYDKVQRALVKMRRAARVPYGWIVDGTRWMHKPRSFSSREQALQRTAESYRRAVWDDQSVRVEIWLEKQGLAGTILPVTSEFDVPLYVSRGFSSLTYLAEAAEDIEACGKPVYIYYLGDHDEWGHDAGKHIERELRRLAPSAKIYFERLAVTVKQIADLNLPTRPLKSAGKLRERFEAEHGGTGAVELDAIHPDTLRALVRDAIEQHIDFHQLESSGSLKTRRGASCRTSSSEKVCAACLTQPAP